MTETSGNDPAWLHANKDGAPDGALVMGTALHDGLVAGHLNAWVYWSFQDGDHVSSYNLTARGDKNSKKYNAAKQYFRYIRPGAVRVAATPDTDDLNVTAFLHEQQKTLTIVCVNSTEQPANVSFAITASPKIASFKVFATTATENFAAASDAKVMDGKIPSLIPAQSILTLYGVASDSPLTAE